MRETVFDHKRLGCGGHRWYGGWHYGELVHFCLTCVLVSPCN